MSRIAFLLFVALVCHAQVDVLIVGGSSSGIGAGIGAARLGVSVLLVEDTPVLGGMLSNGISNIDSYSYESLSGVFDEFRQQVRAHYGYSGPIPSHKATHLDGHSFAAHQAEAGGRWEPHVASEIFRRMASQYPNLKILYRTVATGVVMDGRRIAGVTFEDANGTKTTVTAKVVIDATHEGDIAAWAGAPYRVGREARSPLEPHAGHIYFYNATNEILPGSTGRQDQAIPSSGLRVCIKKYASGAPLIARPPGYDPEQFRFSTKGLSTDVPGGKFEMNVNPIGNEIQELNWTWPEGSLADRKKLYELHKNRALSYLYYLQHDLGRTDLGLPDDEFVDNGHLPYRVFIREARRIEGEATMTEADINPFLTGSGWLPPFRSDSIAVGEYPIDAKPVRPKTDFTKPDKGEGDFYLIDVTTAFQVPYGSIVPKQVEGLLVPTALSATHVAFSAVRMDPTWTVLGQAAGVAAALSVKDRMTPRQLAVNKVQSELLRQKARLVFYWDLPLDHPAFQAIESLSLRGSFRGFPDRTIQPDAPLTRAQAAALLVRHFKLWPSVSGHHFRDVPYTHWAFRDVETLHDANVLGFPALWPQAGPYQGTIHAGFSKPAAAREFLPNQSITSQEWRDWLNRIRPFSLPPLPPGPVSRARAALDLYSLPDQEGVNP
ncbi:FAD-dependent oxidoreductase [uncultured Paludibaculum sp.]|uniref:FAD-dependent oxidoreductase n=1 Tax=uncultured Paludibaculum sp. TaxID=1765020 RepID=UPI002AAA9740|nr:FAD-dependent oxidoreductase [uncultured Paludibaculum sp.]